MTIRLATPQEAEQINLLYRACKLDLDQKGIPQWTDHYPNTETTVADIAQQWLYVLENEQKELLGTIILNEEQDVEYQQVDWKFTKGKIGVIHRLAVMPKAQGKGIARKLMDYAEELAVSKGYSALRLDAFSLNERNLRFYVNRGYIKSGQVFFPGREAPFYCFEKELRD